MSDSPLAALPDAAARALLLVLEAIHRLPLGAYVAVPLAVVGAGLALGDNGLVATGLEVLSPLGNLVWVALGGLVVVQGLRYWLGRMGVDRIAGLTAELFGAAILVQRNSVGRTVCYQALLDDRPSPSLSVGLDRIAVQYHPGGSCTASLPTAWALLAVLLLVVPPTALAVRRRRRRRGPNLSGAER